MAIIKQWGPNDNVPVPGQLTDVGDAYHISQGSYGSPAVLSKALINRMKQGQGAGQNFTLGRQTSDYDWREQNLEDEGQGARFNTTWMPGTTGQTNDWNLSDYQRDSGFSWKPAQGRALDEMGLSGVAFDYIPELQGIDRSRIGPDILNDPEWKEFNRVLMDGRNFTSGEYGLNRGASVFDHLNALISTPFSPVGPVLAGMAFPGLFGGAGSGSSKLINSMPGSDWANGVATTGLESGLGAGANVITSPFNPPASLVGTPLDSGGLTNPITNTTQANPFGNAGNLVKTAGGIAATAGAAGGGGGIDLGPGSSGLTEGPGFASDENFVPGNPNAPMTPLGQGQGLTPSGISNQVIGGIIKSIIESQRSGTYANAAQDVNRMGITSYNDDRQDLKAYTKNLFFNPGNFFATNPGYTALAQDVGSRLDAESAKYGTGGTSQAKYAKDLMSGGASMYDAQIKNGLIGSGLQFGNPGSSAAASLMMNSAGSQGNVLASFLPLVNNEQVQKFVGQVGSDIADTISGWFGSSSVGI